MTGSGGIPGRAPRDVGFLVDQDLEEAVPAQRLRDQQVPEALLELGHGLGRARVVCRGGAGPQQRPPGEFEVRFGRGRGKRRRLGRFEVAERHGRGRLQGAQHAVVDTQRPFEPVEFDDRFVEAARDRLADAAAPPRIYLLSSGELTPFELTLRDGDDSYRIIGSELGVLALERGRG